MVNHMSDKNENELTDEQIENWKRILSQTFGDEVFSWEKEYIKEVVDNIEELKNKPDFGEF